MKTALLLAILLPGGCATATRDVEKNGTDWQLVLRRATLVTPP